MDSPTTSWIGLGLIAITTIVGWTVALFQNAKHNADWGGQVRTELGSIHSEISQISREMERMEQRVCERIDGVDGRAVARDKEIEQRFGKDVTRLESDIDKRVSFRPPQVEGA